MNELILNALALSPDMLPWLMLISMVVFGLMALCTVFMGIARPIVKLTVWKKDDEWLNRFEERYYFLINGPYKPVLDFLSRFSLLKSKPKSDNYYTSKP